MKNLQHFKKTEIGLIPNDWELKKFSEIFSFLSTGTYSRAQIHEEGDVGYIHYGDIHTKLDFKVDTSKYVSGFVSEIEGKPYARIRQGDLIIADASEDVNGIGKSIEVINQPANKVISGLHTFLARDIRDTFALGFKGYIDSNILVKKQYIKLASGLKVYSLSKANFDKIWLPIPPLAEQRKIAQALTDADNYISALEKLIEKKKMMKEGLINRFFSNNQDWKELTLFDIAENNRSLFNDGDWIEAEYITSEGVRLIQTGNIGIGKYVDKEANKKYVSEASFQLLNCKVLKDQDILICRLAEPAGRACIFHATSEKTITSVDVTIFRPKTEKYNRNFLVYAMSMPTWFSKISENVGGTTHKRISRSNLGEITIKVPNLATQNRIAQILTTMDNQLDLLIGKLEKAKSIKIGMMQKLLTGEIRLA